MIDSLLLIFGVQNNYTIFAIMLAGCIIIFFLLEFLYLLSSIFKWVGGFK